MPQVVIQVGEVKPASVDAGGRKFGAKIVDAAGNKYTVGKNNIHLLGMMVPGQMYQIFYEEKSFQGTQYKELISANPVTGVAGAQAHQNLGQQAGVPPRFQKQPTNPEDAKRMWVCALLGHFISAGKLDINMSDVVEVGRMCLEAHELIFNPPPGQANGQMQPQRPMAPAYPGGSVGGGDMNEEIPFAPEWR